MPLGFGLDCLLLLLVVAVEIDALIFGEDGRFLTNFSADLPVLDEEPQ